MSLPVEKQRIPRAQALAVAEEMVARLSGACARIAIVGSLRRGKQEVGDVELLFVPRYTEKPDGLFSQRIVDVADERCDQLLKNGVLAKRPNKKGHPAGWGVSNKLAIHCASGIPLDLFSCPPENWWVSLVIRTGSKDTCLALTMGANRLGRSLVAYGAGVKLPSGEIVWATSEEEVFTLCGCKYLTPEKR